MYQPDQSDKLYARVGVMSNNRCAVTINLDGAYMIDCICFLHSQVDLMNIDHKQFPLVASAQYSEHVLVPGEMLFIPRWCWHLVQAIDKDTALRWREARGHAAVGPVRDIKCETTGSECSVERTGDSASGAVTGVAEFSISVSFWWGQRLEKTK